MYFTLWIYKLLQVLYIYCTSRSLKFYLWHQLESITESYLRQSFLGDVSMLTNIWLMHSAYIFLNFALQSKRCLLALHESSISVLSYHGAWYLLKLYEGFGVTIKSLPLADNGGNWAPQAFIWSGRIERAISICCVYPFWTSATGRLEYRWCDIQKQAQTWYDGYKSWHSVCMNHHSFLQALRTFFLG